MADADAGVGLTDLGAVDGVSGHVGAALDQGVDALVETGHRHDPHVLPAEAGAGELAEEVVPDGEVGRIFTGDALALHVLDRLDRRIAPHEGRHHQGECAYHQPKPGCVRKRIASADLEAGPVVGKADVDRIVHAQLELAGLQHGQDRKSTRLNSSHVAISYAVFCLKKKKKTTAHMFHNRKKKKKTEKP